MENTPPANSDNAKPETPKGETPAAPPSPPQEKNAASEAKRRKIKPSVYSGVDPRLRTVESHERSKMRIAKVSILAFAIIMIVFGLAWASQSWKRHKAWSARIAAVEKQLKSIDTKLATASGYDKWKLAAEAVFWSRRGEAIDTDAPEPWQAREREYRACVDAESKPEINRDFVVPYALIDMAYVPAGTFIMGAKPFPRQKGRENPRRQVVIGKSFWMGRMEITNSQFLTIYPNHITPTWRDMNLNKPEQPTAMIDWHQAREFCRILTFEEQKNGRVPRGYEYRLPTEAEWEYAARAGSDTHYYWGDNFGALGAEFANSLDLYAASRVNLSTEGEKEWMAPRDGFIVASPVGSFKPNAFGLRDMIGNVWEWCYDWYNPNAYADLGSADPVQYDPVSVTIEKVEKFDRRYEKETPCKVLRGGSWGNLPSSLRCAARDWEEPGEKNRGVGFRIVLAPVLRPPGK